MRKRHGSRSCVLCALVLAPLLGACRLIIRLLDMWRTCLHVNRMPKMIQLRHVPDDLHRALKARAAQEGLSLSDYLLEEVRHIAERPTISELRRRLAEREPVAPRVSSAKVVRAARDGR